MSITMLQEAPDISPDSYTEPGLSHFMEPEQMRNRTPRAFVSSLLTEAELARICQLLPGPQHPARIDKKLINLGFVNNVLGKSVATGASRRSLWQERYEVRRGNDKRPLKLVQTLEAENFKDAMTTAWNIARRDVGERWRYHLVQSGDEPSWSIFLPPPRSWAHCSIRPYVLEITKI